MLKNHPVTAFARSLRARVLLLLALTFLIVLAVATHRASERRQADLTAATERLRAHAGFIAEEQEDTIAHAREFLASVIDSVDIVALAEGPSCAETLERFVRRERRFANLFVVTPSGDVLCNPYPAQRPVNLADRDFFARALAAPQPVIGDAVLGRFARRWVLPIAQRFTNAFGAVQGILVLGLDLGWVNQELAKVPYAEGARISLVDSHGLVLARHPDPEHLVGQQFATLAAPTAMAAHGTVGTVESAGLDGVVRVYAVAHLVDTATGPIALRLGVPKAAIERKANEQFAQAMAITLAVAALALSAAWFGSERLLIAPIRSIIATARRLGQGDHQARTSLARPSSEIAELASAIDEMARSLASGSEVLRLNRALKVLSSCNRALVHARDEEHLLAEVCRIIVEIGGYRMAFVGFAEDDADKTVRPAAQHGFEAGYLARAHISWGSDERGSGPTGTAIRTGERQINRDFESNPRVALWRDDALRHGYHSSAAFPLMSGESVMGALTIYSPDRDAFGPDEVRLLEELAADLAFGTLNMRLRQAHERTTARLGRSMEATVTAVAATLERRDPYTAGHQRRVADLATAIAHEMGLSAEETRGIHLAAVVHDIGKVQIPAEILTKPTRLDDTEYELLQEHPQAGYEILKGIDFPWPIAELVRQHHERMDGSGYPRGLKGEETLLGARILAVADVVEAISSARPYRPSLGVEVALREIEARRGQLYDPAVADACVRLFRQQRFAFDQTQGA